jgi:hypothetical protein
MEFTTEEIVICGAIGILFTIVGICSSEYFKDKEEGE